MSRIKTLIIALILVILGSGYSYAIWIEEAIPQESVVINKAINSVQDGEWSLTKKYGEELIKKYPNAYPGYLFLGIALDEKRKHKKALEYYQKALEYAPGNSDILQNMGYAYLHMKDYPNAIKYYKKALELDPNSEYANEQLQQAYSAYSVGSIRNIPITKIDENHFKIEYEKILSSVYLAGKSLVNKEVANPLKRKLVKEVEQATKCKYGIFIFSYIRNNIEFKGSDWDSAVGNWIEYWKINACGYDYEIPVEFKYQNNVIKGRYNISELKKVW